MDVNNRKCLIELDWVFWKTKFRIFDIQDLDMYSNPPNKASPVTQRFSILPWSEAIKHCPKGLWAW